MSSLPSYRPVPTPDTDDNSQLDTVCAFVRQLARERYFGHLQISYQSGHITNLRRDESLKPESLPNLIANSKGSSHVNKSE
jgi:hypothetical protein